MLFSELYNIKVKKVTFVGFRGAIAQIAPPPLDPPLFPITTKWCFDQDVKVVPGATFTKRMCDRCCSLQKRRDVVATSQLMLR